MTNKLKSVLEYLIEMEVVQSHMMNSLELLEAK